MSSKRPFKADVLAMSMLALGAAGCADDSAAPPGAVSEGEASALDKAAEMLDETRPPLDAIAPPDGEEASQSEAASADLTGDASR